MEMQRRNFSREFKLEAVKLVRERGVSVSQAARDLDLHENVLRKWVREQPTSCRSRRLLVGEAQNSTVSAGERPTTERLNPLGCDTCTDLAALDQSMSFGTKDMDGGL